MLCVCMCVYLSADRSIEALGLKLKDAEQEIMGAETHLIMVI